LVGAIGDAIERGEEAFRIEGEVYQRIAGDPGNAGDDGGQAEVQVFVNLQRIDGGRKHGCLKRNHAGPPLRDVLVEFVLRQETDIANVREAVEPHHRLFGQTVADQLELNAG